MKVLKFGGTSVGSAESINTLIDILKRESQAEQKPVFVLSAMSGITNLLAETAEQAALGESFTGRLADLEIRHFDAVKKLVDIHNQNPLLTRLKIYFNELEDLFQGVLTLRELTPKTRDLILSYGEKCSALMVSRIALQSVPGALFVDASTLVKTDSSFGQAKVITQLTDLLIQEFYRENTDKTLIVTGFIASDDAGNITTLGRGGSDYTAALFGAALNAEAIEIWTDVNGMMTADPRIVKKAFSLTDVTYTEAMELSYFGAKVIYPPTMIPAFLKQIPIVIKNTFEPEFEGTVISGKAQPSGHPIKGISSINQISVINLTGSGMVGKAGFSGRLFSLLAREQINVILITQSSSEHTITFAVHPADAPKAKALIEQEFELELLAKKLEAAHIEDDLAVLAVVGENMKQTPGMSGKLFHALGRNGVNVRAIAQGSSEYNISVIISANALSKALNAVHDAFFTELNKTLHAFCLGTGNIGKTLFKQLYNHSKQLREKNKIQVKIAGISNSRKMTFNAEGLSLQNWEQNLNEKGEAANIDEFFDRMVGMNLPNCVFVDNTASPLPVAFYERAFKANISVVTCNKLANSSGYAQYRNFKDTAIQRGVDFFYETNVGAGLPIISTLKNLMVSGDHVQRMEAILSGTISFIFNNFKGDASFHDVVKMAQEAGYTEPDPRDDLRGTDFMRKVLILSRDSGYPMEASDIQIENILPQSCLDAQTVPDFYAALKAEDAYFNELKERAEREKKVLRYIGKLENGKAVISLQMVNENHPFYMMSGADNIIAFTTDRYYERPMVVKGPGAGAEVTAAGVFADLINVGAN
ncbi:bifunctional aspartate kinase/homoserine dehydrogenase I [Mucilaginibacter ginkgonis]|uniref:Bifunctional aspartate kinase/homoserine dehydrogenase I n=1 Tax=Mucilaginibacter ginkgonis TaxID=2682091 RepID=A0A6I4HYD7_9SPHI|nr:bifunctional aspartate kinase/homoserine dehydrogenase I [Mucilaginibacter ginkgonis]QQL49483.1 bifunctional aspartate kinase/homoserine dehydrogenase I [Mucilaginibacter ginkgonis]